VAHIILMGMGAGLDGVACACERKKKHAVLRKVTTGSITPVYEKYVLSALGIEALEQ
jgi:hypothetical protein